MAGNVVEDEADRQLEKLQGAVTKLVRNVDVDFPLLYRYAAFMNTPQELLCRPQRSGCLCIAACQATKESISEDSLRRLDRHVYKTEEAVDALQIEGIPEERPLEKDQLSLLALRRAIDAAKPNLDRKSVMSTKLEDLPKGNAGSYRGTEDPTQVQTSVQAIQLGHAIANKSVESVSRTKIIARETEEIGRNTLREMHQQQGKAEQIVEHFDSIESNLQRARGVVKQIARGAANDRCVQVLCFFIGIATLVIIILKATGGSDNLLEEDQPAVVAL